jgi:hypothetical protein
MKIASLATTFIYLIMAPMVLAEGECVIPEVMNKNVCKVLQINQKSIQKRRDERAALETLQTNLYEATQLRDRLQDPENLQETDALDENLVNEMALMAEEKEGQTYKAVASVGSLMVFSFIIKRMYKSTKGLSMLAKLKAQASPFRGGVLKTTVNSAFILSLGMSFFTFYKIKQTKDQMNDLQQLIKTLNKLKDQAQNLAKITIELEDMETCFWFKVDGLVDQGLAKIEGSELICHE